MSALLEAVCLNKRFGAVVAAQDLNISVPAGQRLCLIGSNGAGKTTFVNMVTGYLRPDSGQIRLRGEDVTGQPPRTLAHRGICRSFQIPQLFLELTALENLLVAVTASHPRGLSLWRPGDRADAVARAHELLARFSLEEAAHRPVSELAGGVRKLIDIAMALARRPLLLLLDEPTSAVSADEKFVTMERVMQALAHEQATVVFVEHDMEIVSRFSERVLAFYSGRVIADGTPADVLVQEDVQRHVTGGAA